jgi:serine protease Do
MKQSILTRSIRSLLIVPLLLGAVAFAQETKMPEIRVDAQDLKRDDHSSYAPIIDRVTPSVVTISTEVSAEKAAARATRDKERMMNDPFLRRFFGLPDNEEPAPKKAPVPSKKKFIRAGLGSGVIISADGYILTNHHVVAEADVITVTLSDSKTHKATKIASDEGSDIAVIKIEASGLSPVTFADSEKAKVGDVVLAIGSPFEFRQSVSRGIISALGRNTKEISQFSNFIQTDASINPGNSGGALIDTQGRLVGIPTAIFSRSGGNMGIGFAVPSTQARTVMESLLKFGRVARGYLGIGMLDIDETLAKNFALKSVAGVVVTVVASDSPAAKAGLRDEDVILELNGKAVEGEDSFRNKIAAIEPGKQVELKIVREGKEMLLPVTLGDRPGTNVVSTKPMPQPVEKKAPDVLDGVQVGDITAEQRRALRIDDAVKGALVIDVGADTPSADAELRKGDIILAINGKEVTNAEDAVKLSEEVKNLSTVRLRVNRRGQPQFVIVEERKDR